MMTLTLKKAVLLFLSFFAFAGLFSQSRPDHGRIRVTSDGHFLEYSDGTPFFWLGDTGWELFSKLKKEEIENYLDNRKAKGFNVIQCVILRRNADRYGDLPLHNNDPEKPVERYFALVDWVVKKAQEKNMMLAILPCWGDMVTGIRSKVPPIFNETNAFAFGRYLGNRYKNCPNIIWVAGGDNPAFVDSADWRPVFRSMIKGIRAGTGNQALVTYHPWGENSSTVYWKDENTLDFNMMQSGHRTRDLPVWEWVKRDRSYRPAKPVLDGEPNYEDHPVNWDNKNGYFRAYDVRKQLYRSVFSGACGVTYGHHAIWQFYSKTDKKPIAYADRYWTEALDRPGAFQAGYLKKLIASRTVNGRIPDQSIIETGQGEKGEYITAFHGADSNYAMIYLPVGKRIGVNTTSVKGSKIIAWWFNPKNDKAIRVGLFAKERIMSFTPPDTGSESDWVLVLDNANKRFSDPDK
jgi:hypothetical protein